MDKFVISIVSHRQAPAAGMPVRIQQNAYDRLLTVKRKTGLSMGKLITLCIDFALDRLDIQYITDDDEEEGKEV